MRIRFFFAWFDFWIGFYWDRKERTLLIAPLPCLVFEIKRRSEPVRGTCPKCGHDREQHVSVGCLVSAGKGAWLYCACRVSHEAIPAKIPSRGILSEIGQAHEVKRDR
jgi:hypothetical protein